MIHIPKTIGDIREAIKDFPDDLPVLIDDENDYIEALSIKEREVSFYSYDLEEDVQMKAFVIGIT